MFERLKYNYREYPLVTPARTALHPTLKAITLYRPDPAKLAQLPAYACGIASVDPKWHERSGVPELLTSHGLTRLDLLQIDVEGFDAEVIRMIDFSRVRPGIIKYESWDRAADAELERMPAAQGYMLRRNGHDVITWTRD